MGKSSQLSKSGWKYRLSYRVLLYILLCSAGFTCIGTAFQLYVEHKKDRDRVAAGLNQIQESYLNFLSLSLWDMDERQLNRTNLSMWQQHEE